MSFSYAYRYPCVVQDPLTPSNVLIIGINGTTDATIEVTRVDIADITKPSARRLNSIVDATRWSSTTERVCDMYPQNGWISEIPTFYIRQFGGRSYMADFLSNGTIYRPIEMNPPLASSKLYSSVGTYQDYKFVTTMAATADPDTSSPWSALSIYRNSTGPDIYGTFQIQQYPPADARLSVGTSAFATNMPVFGYLTVFDSTGSKGWVYPTTSSHQTTESSTSLQALAPAVNVDMSGITLSADAISITMGTTGYIIDKASDGSTALFSISPDSRSTPKLVPVAVRGNVPRFLPGRTSTLIDSNKLLLFGGIQDGAPTSLFHSFDTSSLSWSGLDLVAPSTPQQPFPSKNSPNMGAIAGGVAGGVVALALVAFFILRRFRRKHHKVVVPNSATDFGSRDDPPAVVMTDVVYSPNQPPEQHQYHQHFSAYDRPVMYSPEQIKQPLIYQPQASVAMSSIPQEAVYQPRDSTYYDASTPSTTNTTLSPTTAQTAQLPASMQPGSPQYVPLSKDAN